MSLQNKSNFREDINGLRAIAVLAVVIFHISPDALTGGFSGVDVFFVISGYLMTSIIFRGFENDNFSLWKFIINRAKRIVPALLALIFILLIIGYITLDPEGYKVLARHSRDSLGFISNITYNNESGYFDTASKSKFLLHTWSLSVEWQFYIIYPIILMGFKRLFSIQTLKYSVIVLLFISLTASILISQKTSSTAYYMFYTRAWEMLFGGLAFIFPIKQLSNPKRFYMELIGLILIIYSLFAFNARTLWPSYNALYPVIGTYLCILANNKNTILSGTILNKIGLWSYSIYLVHWPIIAFSFVMDWALSTTIYLSLTLILAVILYETIEKYRNYKYGLLFTYILMLCATIFIRETNGIEQRFPQVPQSAKDSLYSGSIQWQPGEWLLFNQNDQNVDYIFYGDSFSSHYRAYFNQQPKSIANLYSPACFSSPNYYSNNEQTCKDLYSILQKNILNNPADTLVLSYLWGGIQDHIMNRKNSTPANLSEDELIETFLLEFERMKNELKVNKVVIIAENNHFIPEHEGISPTECISRKYIHTLYDDYTDKKYCQDVIPKSFFSNIDSLNHKLKDMVSKREWLYYIDPNEALCNDDLCVQIKDKDSLFADPIHLSVFGANIIAPLIFKELKLIDNNSYEH